jgi:GNAT superfamily N-acetyltransferase
MNTSIPGITLRDSTAEDSEAIVEVVNAHSLKTLGTKRATIDARGKLRFARYIPARAERVVAITPEGRIVAFLHLAHESPYIATEIGLAVHPDYEGQGLETRLLAWGEERARQWLSLAPAEARVVLQANVFDADLQGQALLLNAGYHLVREWIHLEITMSEPPPAPVWPEDIRVRLMDQSRDWPRVGPALVEAFVDHWGYTSLESEVKVEEEEAELADTNEDDPYFNSRDFCFVALAGDEVVGSCLGDARTIEWPDSGKIGSLSIRRPYRGRGIAKGLVLHALNEFYRHGTRRVITDTDANSFTGANYLYQSAGMKIFRRDLLYEKELRAGQEFRDLHFKG